MEGAVLFFFAFLFTGRDTWSGYGYASSNAMLLPKIPLMSLQMVPTIMGFHTALLLTKELTSQQMQWGNGADAHGIHGCHHVPHHPEALGLLEGGNGLWETQLQCQLGGNNFQGCTRMCSGQH